MKILQFSDIVGQEEAKLQLRSALLMQRNIIIVGPPGVGKTTLARNIARLLPETVVTRDIFGNPTQKKKTMRGEQRFVRVQGSPDLTVEDLIGDIDPLKALKYGPFSKEAFTPGKIFKAHQGVLFFDELNRCPEKLQNALLQVLEEKKVTISNFDVDIPADFIFIGTMNPEDFTGTERLSEVLLDRFDMIYMSYPKTIEDEKKIIITKAKKQKGIGFPDNLLLLTLTFIRELREHKDLERVPSVRASLGLYERAQANAFLNGKKTVTTEDIKEALISVLAHRIRFTPRVKYLTTPEKFVKTNFEKFLENQREEIQPEQRGDGP
ncbi:ATP-binding protein [Candidatus Woesearchaeota archaeon]|nr:ATP-binding protein [Candidatus Woesearchaeota archaeon]